MGIISWIVLGLIAGALAKWIMPGKDPGGFIVTILIGVAGAFVGGFVGSLVGLGTVGGLSLGSIVTAIVGALILLFAYRLIANRAG
ncbi:GlsB/YeaQ/YmgE family stress response membrane protein [Algiphilus sp.]|uniref:GlsB/YeaQ/YmgE family stress response membrane protein n=1 Tax=Algiphilus sp. TaxID=1872431 RepID=UPI001CA704CC|nr:GlsB/YeaQ/YmgE family stress response membrane protein [Algiphilus sp.]MBY8964211.1 GlsB/YeaQ/YmgE family stress response membrane protein [Algiphilus acroporae]MCI5061525.1 GlsB/YeaQ/YmgE family stress response membrane protein [Algiphilus sp.]MCI5102279.1 GlsB/YeaQ/YmgE family stress response membrane protein [Algiphilus sp.]MCR9090184.1 GlsB/YeaQ/YmgE family stress response membrane protein [Pseudomonadota bacterium]